MLRDDSHDHHNGNGHDERHEHPVHPEHPEHPEHPQHPGQHLYETPQQDHLTPPRKDALPINFGDLAAEPWMPGLVEVEFEDGDDSGVFDEDFVEATERRKPSDQWTTDLLKVLLQNQMLSWKPSFPLTYSWSKKSREQAKESFRKQRRDRFVTFQFVGKADVAEVAAQLRRAPKVVRAQPVARLVPSEINEPLLGSSDRVQKFADGFENQWYAFRCNLPDALEQVTGRGVVIAAIDWGFDHSHQDYSGSIELKRNIYHESDGVGCGNAIHHGTAVLGLAGARLNNHGMAGFAPNSILWAIQAGEDEVMHPDYWREAIDFVVETPSPHRKVIILEAQTAKRGNIEGIPAINQAIVNAIEAGVVVCVPAGNAPGRADLDDQEPPQVIPETGSILVGATTIDDVPLGKGGDRIGVYAPGDPAHDVTCTSLPQRHTNFFGGTSSAAAKVAGAVALLLEANSSLTPAEVKELLQQSQTTVFKSTTREPEEVGVSLDGPEEAGVLLDCSHAVYACTQQNKQAHVLTKSSAML
jgi:subtilisin family serine protease